MAIVRILLTSPLFVFEVIKLNRLLKHIKPDIVHINNGGYPAALSARACAVAAHWAGVSKVVMVVNNMADGYRDYSRWQDYPFDRLVAHSVDVFITGSQAAATQLRHVLKLPESQVKSIYNGIELRVATENIAETRCRLGIDNFDGLVLGVVALMIPRKGHRVLLEALVNLLSTNTLSPGSLRVLLEGNGPLRATLEEYVHSHKLNDMVYFVGDERNIINFMQVIDGLVLPSISDEDFPNVILEAMALGKPVLSTCLAGIPEQIVDGITGRLVPPGNLTELADTLHEIIQFQDKFNSMGVAGRQRFDENFTAKQAIAKYSDLYKTLLNDVVN